MELSVDSKSNLSRVWLAAHWERKLTKSQITSHDIRESVAAMTNPNETLALRVNSHLLLGLVKIAARKASYLLSELEEVLEQLQQSFKTNAADLLKAAGITALPKDITMSARKPASSVDTYEDPLSMLNSTRSSVEKPRYIANRDQITMSESETTPLAARYTLRAMRESQFGMSNSFLDDVENSKSADNQMSMFEVTPADMDLENASPETEPEAPANDLQAAMDLEPPPRVSREPLAIEAAPDAPQDVAPRARSVKKRRQKNEWREDEAELIENYEGLANLESTNDIVRNPNFYAPSSVKVPIDSDSIFYSPLVKCLCPELSNFYTSHIKLLRLKNALQEADEAPQEFIDQELNMPEPDKYSEGDRASPRNEAEAPDFMDVEAPEENGLVKDEEQVEWHEQWSGRTVKMLKLMQARLEGQESINYSELSKVNDRKTTACGFYELLVLTAKGYLEIEQEAQFADITVKSTPLLFQI